MAKQSRRRKPRRKEILDYDNVETGEMVRTSPRMRLEQLGFRLPEVPPTQVISIRLPSALLNRLRALASQKDVPYQSLIKLYLSEAVEDQAA